MFTLKNKFAAPTNSQYKNTQLIQSEEKDEVLMRTRKLFVFLFFMLKRRSRCERMTKEVLKKKYGLINYIRGKTSKMYIYLDDAAATFRTQKHFR